MKKIIVVLALLALTVPVLAQISNSAHDFSSNGWSGGEICITCHTPHNASSSAGGPLWNHAETTATFTLYTSTTLTATDLGQPSGTSKLCLGCHDGTVALDSFGGSTGSSFISGSELVGTDLGTSHPISFTYDATLATNDGGLYDPTTANSGLGSTIDADLLFGNKVECSSCHDVHDSANQDSLLVMSNASSALCLTCHNK